MNLQEAIEFLDNQGYYLIKEPMPKMIHLIGLVK